MIIEDNSCQTRLKEINIDVILEIMKEFFSVTFRNVWKFV